MFPTAPPEVCARVRTRQVQLSISRQLPLAPTEIEILIHPPPPGGFMQAREVHGTVITIVGSVGPLTPPEPLMTSYWQFAKVFDPVCVQLVKSPT